MSETPGPNNLPDAPHNAAETIAKIVAKDIAKEIAEKKNNQKPKEPNDTQPHPQQ